VRVVIAEDLALLRDGLERLLRDNGFEVAAAVDDADALVHAVLREQPDLAIVDIRLPPSFRDEGLRAALELRHTAPATAILILSQYVEHTYAAELLAEAGGGGGVGYLLKDRVLDVDDFVDAVRRVASGGTALDLMAEGRSNAAIAKALVLTVGAVEKHIASIFQKLRLPPSESDHRRVLAVLAYLQG
jgi:DNA-binding NarL/FixJ family response regulator